jgi:hypothetical protein
VSATFFTGVTGGFCAAIKLHVNCWQMPAVKKNLTADFIKFI